jgi:hypothetical protein
MRRRRCDDYRQTRVYWQRYFLACLARHAPYLSFANRVLFQAQDIPLPQACEHGERDRQNELSGQIVESRPALVSRPRTIGLRLAARAPDTLHALHWIWAIKPCSLLCSQATEMTAITKFAVRRPRWAASLSRRPAMNGDETSASGISWRGRMRSIMLR